MADIELADLISQLRTELAKARTEGHERELQFEVGPVELELAVAVTREAGASAKVKFLVVELGGNGKINDQTTQRIKLTLTPKLANSDKMLVHGDAVKGEH